MYAKNKNAFPQGKWSYDGHGVNLDGARILTLNQPAHDYPNGTPRRNENRDRMGNQLEQFCNEAHRLEVESGHLKAPRLFLNLDANEVDAMPHSLICVDLKRDDGKIARFHLNIAVSGDSCKATLTAVGENKDSSTPRS